MTELDDALVLAEADPENVPRVDMATWIGDQVAMVLLIPAEGRR